MSLNEDKIKVQSQADALIVGIGNPLRCDDGVGSYIADCIESRGLKGVKVWVVHQLNVEDLERMLEYNRIILVDAAIAGPLLDFRPVCRSEKPALASSHHLSAETLMSLAQSIYHKDLRIHLCSIKGSSFEVGDKISPDVLERAHEAVELICCSLMNKEKG